MLLDKQLLDQKYARYLDYGIHRQEIEGKSYYIVSFRTFNELINALGKNIFDENSIIITPELITLAGKAIDKQVVEQRIDQVIQFSVYNPQLTIILGTPYWIGSNKKPTNCALIINDGEIKQVVTKRYPIPLEAQVSELIPSQTNEISQNTSLIICRDLALDTEDDDTKKLMQERFLEDLDTSNLLDRNTETLIVIACWGSSGQSTRSKLARIKSVQIDNIVIDQYANDLFELSLHESLDRMLEKYPNLKTIIVCDRAPFERSTGPDDSVTSTMPFNIVYTRDSK